jgi:phosphoribosylformylglycinamidine cyclo-ligase
MTERGAYRDLGVSSSKGDVHKAIKNLDPGLFKGSFSKIVPDILTCDKDWCVASHSDGAGTKSIVAYLRFKETGSARCFRSISQDSIVMNLDDLLCIGATDRFLLSNTINRNLNKIPAEVLSEIICGYEDFIGRMARYGVRIENCGGETADIGDSVRNVIVDSNLVTRMRRKDVITAANVRGGDDIVGFSGAGRALYDDKVNSGIGGNGLTLARHALLSSHYDQYAETFDSAIDAGVRHRGPFLLSDSAPGLRMSVGDALLSPSRTYAPVIRKVLADHRSEVHGMVHCTGGGQVKCISFGMGIRYVKDDLFSPPPIFGLIRETGRIEWREMYRTFNMGHRMELYVDPSISSSVVGIAKKLGVDAKVVGRCESAAGRNSVEISSEYGKFGYLQGRSA